MSDNKKIKIIVCSISLIIALVFGLAVPGIITAKKNRCTEAVPGIIVDAEMHNDDGTAMYTPIYEAEIDGTTKRLKPSYSTSVYPDVGKEITVYLNPDNHDEFYVPGIVEIIVIVFRVVGGIFLLAAILFAIAKL